MDSFLEKEFRISAMYWTNIYINYLHILNYKCHIVLVFAISLVTRG